MSVRGTYSPMFARSMERCLTHAHRRMDLAGYPPVCRPIVNHAEFVGASPVPVGVEASDAAGCAPSPGAHPANHPERTTP